MATYKAPLRDIRFLLNNVFDAGELFASMPDTTEITDDLIAAIVEAAGKIAEGLLAPLIPVVMPRPAILRAVQLLPQRVSRKLIRHLLTEVGQA